MANTITDGTTVITPELILGWDTSQQTRNIIHEIIGKPSPDVTLKPASLRTGTMELLFKTSTEAETARNMLTQALPFTIESDETWLNNIKFVINGSVGASLEDVTRSLWVISADFQEVSP